MTNKLTYSRTHSLAHQTMGMPFNATAEHGREAFLQLLLAMLERRPEVILTGIEPDTFLRYLAPCAGEDGLRALTDDATTESLAPSTAMLCLIAYSKLAGPQHQQFLDYAISKTSVETSDHWDSAQKCLLVALQLAMAVADYEETQRVATCLIDLVKLRTGENPLIWWPPTKSIIDGMLWCLPVVVAWGAENGDTRLDIPSSLVSHIGTLDAKPVNLVLPKLLVPSQSLLLAKHCTQDEWTTLYMLHAVVSSGDVTLVTKVHWSKVFTILRYVRKVFRYRLHIDAFAGKTTNMMSPAGQPLMYWCPSQSCPKNGGYHSSMPLFRTRSTFTLWSHISTDGLLGT